jgi:YQGE family putative transporter
MRKFTLSFLGSFLDRDQISRDLILLLTIGGLYALGIFLSNTFVNVYLWRQTNDFLTIAFYNLAIYIFQALTFIVAGKLAKKIDRIVVLRLGVSFLSVFFLTVLIIGKHAATFNVLLGCLLGIGYGFYWLAFNVLTFEITEPETRDFFNGFMGGLESLGGMVGPLLAGIIIANMKTNIGYMTVFSISFGLFILAVICSFFVNKRDARGIYHLRTVFSEIRFNLNWKNVLLANLFQGMREGLFVFVVTIWVFLITKSEFSLGVFNLCLSAFSFIFYFLVTKFVKPHRRKEAILIGCFIISLSVLIILFKLSYLLLIIYAIVVGMFYPVLTVPFNSMAYDVIGKSKLARELRIEYVVILEVFVNIGRVISVSTFIIFVMVYESRQPIPYLLAIFSQAYLLIYFFMRKVSLSVKNNH